MSRKSAKRRHTLTPNPTHAASKPPSNPLSKAHFLHTEDEAQFCTLLREYVETYNPRHRDEYDLLTEAVYAKWRQQRYWLAEAGQIEIAIARNEATLRKELPRADAAAHLANGVAHSEDLMRLYLRYNQQLHRQYLRCLKELRDLQAERGPSPSSPGDSPKEANPEIEHPETSTRADAHPNRDGGDRAESTQGPARTAAHPAADQQPEASLVQISPAA